MKNKKKSKVQFLIKAFILFFILFILLYVFFFNTIAPGYKSMNGVDIVTNTWNADNDISTIENYFIELNNYKSRRLKHVDSKGILYRTPYKDKKKYAMKPDVEKLYIASDMSGEIIKNHNKFLTTQDSTCIDKIVLYSDWLKKSAVIEKDFAIWPYDFKFTKYDLDYGWCGSWALGYILSGISRSVQLTEDTSYIAIGVKAVNTFNTTIEEGGALYIDDEGDYWYEEYPAIPPSHVLNGHINGMMGLYDFWRVTNHEKAKELFDKGIITLENNLNEFDSGYWTYYDDQYPYLADYFYHKGVHIPQLKVLYQMTGKEIFNDYAIKWEKYMKEPYYTGYKLKMIYDGLHRRFTYKSFFSWGK